MVRRNRIFHRICFVSAVTLVAYIHWANTRGDEAHGTKGDGEPASQGGGSPSNGAQNKPSKRIFFRYDGAGSHYGHLAIAPSECPEQPQFVDALSCEVAHVAGGRGIFLASHPGLFDIYAAKISGGKSLRSQRRIQLKGGPSRCRVSTDGKLAALTVFVSGHGYDSMNFSTQTLLIDADNGRIISDLEGFTVTSNGQ